MRLLTIFTGLLLILFAYSCAQESPLNYDGLGLNEGEKWVANPETTEGINNMISIVTNDKSNSIEAYQQLSTKLGEEKTNIFKLCTMKGEPHENLHAYLIPLIGLINDLAEDETIEDAKESVATIKSHLEAYDYYFAN